MPNIIEISKVLLNILGEMTWMQMNFSDGMQPENGFFTK
jgi:hypothetical protein